MNSVSVVMATFNGEKYIEQQLESLSAQTRQPDELIISDDGSADATLEIVGRFARRAGFPVRILQNGTRLGYGENFLSAAVLARSELVAFCDQDDIWHEAKLALCCQSFDDPAVSLCAHAARLIDARGAEIGVFTQGIAKQSVKPPLKLDPWGVFFGFSMVARRNLLDIIPASERGPDSHNVQGLAAHDRWVYVLGIACGQTVLLPDLLVSYRQHGSNVYGRNQTGKLARARKPLAEITATAERYVRIAEHRHKMFLRASAQPHHDQRLREFLRNAASAWEQVATGAERRLAVYRAPAGLGRATELLKNVLTGVYTDRSQGLMTSALVKDLSTLVKRGGRSLD